MSHEMWKLPSLDPSQLDAWVRKSDPPRRRDETMAEFVARTGPARCLSSIEELLQGLPGGLDAAAGGSSTDDRFNPKEPSVLPVSRIGRRTRPLILRSDLFDEEDEPERDVFVYCYSVGEPRARSEAVRFRAGVLIVDVPGFPTPEPRLVCLSGEKEPAAAARIETFFLERPDPGTPRDPGSAESFLPRGVRADEDPFSMVRAGFPLEAWREAIEAGWPEAQIIGLVSVLTAYSEAEIDGALRRFPADGLSEADRFLHDGFKDRCRDWLTRRRQTLADLAAGAGS